MEVLVIIPTYNEAENVEAITKAVLAQDLDLGVLIVDDNSPDGTGRIADEMSAADSRVSVLHREGKEGLGKAYVAGFKHALANTPAMYFIQMDADFSHDPDKLPELVAAAKMGALAIGSRYVPGGGTRNWGLGRRILSKGGSFYARTILGVPNHDVTGGFKCWPRSFLAELPHDDILCGGYSFQAEMTYRTHKAGHPIKEVPIIFTDRRVGQSKMSMGIALEAIWVMWKLRFRRI